MLLARVVDAVADARGAAVRAQQRDVGHVDRHVLVDDAALHRRPRRPLVTLGHVHAVDDHAPAIGEDAGDLAFLPDVLALQHDDPVALVDLHLDLRLVARHHRTSGASDTIRMKRRSRSSWPTGPKMRVPRGCIWSLMSTAAFSSKRM